MTQSRHRPSSCPWRRYTPTTRKPHRSCRTRLALFSVKIRDTSFQNPRSVDAAQRVERLPPDAGPPGGAGDVDGVLGDPGIGKAAAVGTRAGPADASTIALDDDRGVPILLAGQQRGNLRRGPWLGLEGGDAIGDALVVDRRDRSRR